MEKKKDLNKCKLQATGTGPSSHMSGLDVAVAPLEAVINAIVFRIN